VSFLDDVFNVIHGGYNAAKDAVAVAGDVVTLDAHGAVTNTQKLLGDTKNFLEGVQGLGVNLGKIPAKYADNPLVQLADSPPIEVAQLAIEAMKATTGSGQPEDGEEYKKSADLLTESVDILIDAKPALDRWDGTASEIYGETNDAHRRLTSDVQVADDAIHRILSTEADQVVRTRKTLDDTSQWLYDFALSTSWMNLVPGGRAAKLVIDGGAAATGVATAEATTAILVKNVFENAARLREHIVKYNDAGVRDSSGEGTACDPFIQAQRPENSEEPPQPVIPPSSSLPDTTYTVPAPEEPIEHGPPATPYGQ
jgi:hypothetical protein